MGQILHHGYLLGVSLKDASQNQKIKMGCVFSKSEFDNPRIFQVWNVDSEGRHVKPGRIEVTESQLILYQKGDIVVKWPLRSLRRYGFDAELFSFECGRRCPTGPGVYAFKCRRAEVLFNFLQECIQNSGGGGPGTTTSVTSTEDQISLAASIPMHSPPAVAVNGSSLLNGGDMVGPTVDSSGYLEPITVSHHPFPSPGVPPPRNNGGSPGGYVCIHNASSGGLENVEWTAVPTCCSLGTCGRSTSHHYVNNEVTEPAAACSTCIVHQYVNSSVVATTEGNTHRCCSPPKGFDHPQNTYVNSQITALSPGHCAINCVDFNTNYAKLDELLKQEQSVKRHKEQHFYVNVKPEGQSGSSTSSKCVSGRSTPTELMSRNGIVTSPTSPKVVGSHCYSNFASLTPTDFPKEGPQVNYAVLDLDKSDPSNNAIVSPVSVTACGNSLAGSPTRSPEGYAQIDFDRTVALSNSANPCPLVDDSIRKTRHNAVIPCASMSA